jgi:hypothetical protein
MGFKFGVAGLAAATLVLASAGGTAARPFDTTAANSRVQVFMPRGDAGMSCRRVVPRTREVAAPAVLRGALAALLRGPTPAERRLGYGGWFSQRTAGMLRSVRLERGVAYVDFRDLRPVIPNASSSCGSALLLAQLDRTTKQFPAVRRTVYSIGGSRRAFYEWLQLSAP